MAKWADVYKKNLEQGNVQGIPSDLPHIPLEISIQGAEAIQLFCQRMNNLASLSKKRTEDMNTFIQWSCKLSELEGAQHLAFESEENKLRKIKAHADKVAEYAGAVQIAFLRFKDSDEHINRIRGEIEQAKAEGVNPARKLMGI